MSVGALLRSLRGRIAGGAGCLVALALAFGLAGDVTPAYAQLNLTKASQPKVKPGEQMLVESDELVYDYDNNTVAAVGNVKIYYAGYTLEAEKVTYIKATGKLIANGRVKMTDPTGIVFYAEDFDITEDFRDGFVQSLRVDTPDKTHFAAESAERTGGETTTFYNSVYTACEPCKDHPERPPLWQVKAKKIILDDKEKMIYFHDAALEFMGAPIAWIPYFSTADPSVKRKTGFLAPVFGYSEATGFSVTTPYFLALAPNYDLTLSPTYYTEQGFLGEVEWRHRLSNGQYTFKFAGISQQDPEAFLRYNDAGAIVGGTYAQHDFRGGLRTTGSFDINRWWTFGWDGTLLTDRTFTRNYGVLSDANDVITSEVHLTGLKDRNYFDARAEYFKILADKPRIPGDPLALNNRYIQGRQAVVTPVIDHDYIFDTPVLGGEVSLTSNLTVLSRDQNDPFKIDGVKYYHGLAGDFVRVTEELAWQKKIIGPMGQVFTPFASLRGDLYSINATSYTPDYLTPNETPSRFMPAVGFEWSWPIMMTAGSSTHVIEPIAQIIARPDEPFAGRLTNDDAQSLVFDDSNLFQRDKFSGFDRVEGGTRLNAGLRYVGSFADGSTIEGLVGQSFQLAGLNSFAVPDIADVGAYSGLETTDSDYVARLAYDSGNGSRIALRGRFDNEDFTINRGEVEASKTNGPLTASATYVYAREIPNAGIMEPTSQATTSASVTIVENWRVFGSAVYDFNDKHLAKNSLGVAFDNSCLSLSLTYSQVNGVDIPTRSIMARLLLRTLAEGSATADISSLGSSSN